MRVPGLLLFCIWLALPAFPVTAQSPTLSPTPTAGPTPNLFAQPTLSTNWLNLPEKTPIPIDNDYTGGLNLSVDPADVTAEGINAFRTLLAVYNRPVQLCSSVFFLGFGLSVLFRTFQKLKGEETNAGYLRGGWAAFRQSFRKEVDALMPPTAFVPDGQNPTEIEYPMLRPSCTGCLLIGLAVLGVFILGGVVVTSVAAAAKPKPTITSMISPVTPTPMATDTLTPTNTPTVTPTFTNTPRPGETRQPTYTPTITPSFTRTPTFTRTPSPTRTPTTTGTPFVGQLWVSAKALWPKKDALTQSGVPWRALAESGAICPVDWPLGSQVLLETGERYLCADRPPTLAKCRDAICTILVFSQKPIDQQPRQAVIVRSAQSTGLPISPTQRKK